MEHNASMDLAAKCLDILEVRGTHLTFDLLNDSWLLDSRDLTFSAVQETSLSVSWEPANLDNFGHSVLLWTFWERVENMLQSRLH